VKFEETVLPGAWIVDLEPVEDDRGWFARAFAAEEFHEHGIELDIVHSNLSFNRRAGTVRGLHWQADPHGEGKLVRCIGGAVWDVIVDIRPASPTYRRWVGVELNSVNRRALYIPPGFAQGFQTLQDDTELYYEMSHIYAQSHARGIRWDDPALAIDWPPAAERFISERDRALPLLGP
jgi:dTDP-4-dehydrorhamnose 3,5-epimerase